MINFIAVILFIGVIAYCVFGGADFGAGFWDLTAGRAGREPRDLINRSVGPVWEANHTWLIYCLVMLWSAFPVGFTAITTTLYIPLGLAVLGIVARGAGFAFREGTAGGAQERFAGVVFAASSVVTPFFFGAVAGAIASGRVPTGGNGNAVESWTNPTSVLGGVLAALVCAYLAAVFLASEADAEQDERMRSWFRLRALAAGGLAGAAALAGIFVLRSDSPRLFHRLLGPGLAPLILSLACGIGALVLLRTTAQRAARALAVVTVAAVVCGWGVAQYPYVLGTHLTLAEAASPRSSLWVLVIVAITAAVLIAPSLVLLYVLQQRGQLRSHG